jgi:hypothetical protein
MEKESIFQIVIFAIIIAVSVVMREVVFKNNHAANWWGTVLGVVVLASVCGMIGVGIARIINSENWIGGVTVLLFVVAGVVMAFLPPLKEALREKAFLYYIIPGLLATGCFIVLFISLVGLIEEIKNIKKIAPFLIIGFLVIIAVMSVVMREVVYKDNLAANWWGTVNGAISLAFACFLLGAGITYLLIEIFDDSSKYLTGVAMAVGAIIFMFVGLVIAFFPPFKQAFRISAFLYYVMPAISAGLFYLIRKLTG